MLTDDVRGKTATTAKLGQALIAIGILIFLRGILKIYLTPRLYPSQVLYFASSYDTNVRSSKYPLSILEGDRDRFESAVGDAFTSMAKTPNKDSGDFSVSLPTVQKRMRHKNSQAHNLIGSPLWNSQTTSWPPTSIMTLFAAY
ncbi:MAG: hypothetical protein AAGD22_12155 [Verrucomicrobiota bacterium]